MKYFTRQLFDAGQGDPDSPEAIDADEQWRRGNQEYLECLRSVRSQLPKGMQELTDVSLHDGVVKSVAIQGDVLRLCIDRRGCCDPGAPLELVFKGVKSTAGLEHIVKEWFLYDEVYLSDVAGFEYHVLMDHCELIVVADDVELVELK